ncbi:MAG: phosphopantetheine-binding protein [Bacillales bacterium]|nr:phosphopantetheine-binding protein [Bacillales bacterium]
MDIKEKVIHGFKKVVNGKEVTLDSSIKELGLDSLDVVDMLMDMEDEYGIEFDNDEMLAFNTVADVINAIEKKSK